MIAQTDTAQPFKRTLPPAIELLNSLLLDDLTDALETYTATGQQKTSLKNISECKIRSTIFRAIIKGTF